MDFKNSFTVKNVSFFILILLILFFIIKMPDITLLLFCGYVIACAINPFVDKMSEKIPRAAAVTVMITVITLVTLGVFIPIIVMAFNEIRDFVNQLPQQIQNIQQFLDTLKIGGQDIAQYLNIDTVLNNSTMLAKEVIDKSYFPSKYKSLALWLLASSKSGLTSRAFVYKSIAPSLLFFHS